MLRADKGAFVTTSKFSENINTKKISLIDGMQLAQYIINFNVVVSIEII